MPVSKFHYKIKQQMKNYKREVLLKGASYVSNQDHRLYPLVWVSGTNVCILMSCLIFHSFGWLQLSSYFSVSLLVWVVDQVNKKRMYVNQASCNVIITNL